MGEPISVAEAEARFPGSTALIRTLYIEGRIDGEDDPDYGSVFEVSSEADPDLPPGVLLYPYTGYDGIAWWEDGRWLYSNFGETCCAGHWPDGPDYGVYEFLEQGKIGAKVR